MTTQQTGILLAQKSIVIFEEGGKYIPATLEDITHGYAVVTTQDGKTTVIERKQIKV